MTVTRWELEIYHCNGGDMAESKDGDYVSYEDYEKLEKAKKTVHIVSAPGWEDWEAVGAFSTHEKARAFVDTRGYSSWSITEATIDSDEEEENG